MGAQDIIAKAQRIFRPFELDVKEVVWWSIYEIGHRLTDKFDDVRPGEVATRAPRVMLAGDACHTHSPKAGQGMNVSMGDTFNLGWKLISVLTGRADASLLHSYSGERRAAADFTGQQIPVPVAGGRSNALIGIGVAATLQDIEIDQALQRGAPDRRFEILPGQLDQFGVSLIQFAQRFLPGRGIGVLPLRLEEAA